MARIPPAAARERHPLAAAWRNSRVWTAVLVAALFECHAGPGALRPAGTTSAEAGAPAPEDDGTGPVARRAYDFGETFIASAEALVTYPVRVRGSVLFPRDGEGPFPLILVLHGNKRSCGNGVRDSSYRCEPDDPAFVSSHLGYDYLAEPLARAGYVVASIDADDLTTRSFDGSEGFRIEPRAELALRTLDHFAELAAGRGGSALVGELGGRIDLERVGLLGHSRGGEGVVRATLRSRVRTDGPRHPIRAVFALAATDFGRRAPSGVPFGVVLPYCDGDVDDLAGGWMYDDARYAASGDPSPKHQFLALTFNHNAFNTVWSDDDDATRRYPGDPQCDVARAPLDPEKQRRLTTSYAEAFFRYYLGDEHSFGPLLTGAAPPPRIACGDGGGCERLVRVAYQPPAARRLVVEDTLDAATLEGNDLGGRVRLAGFERAEVCTASECGVPQLASRAPVLALSWRGAAAYRADVPAVAGDVSRFRTFSLRVAFDPDDPLNAGGAPDFHVVLRDAAGRRRATRVSAHGQGLLAPPGGASRKVVLSMVDVPIEAFAGLDLRRVRSVELAFGDGLPGSVLVTDIMFKESDAPLVALRSKRPRTRQAARDRPSARG